MSQGAEGSRSASYTYPYYTYNYSVETQEHNISDKSKSQARRATNYIATKTTPNVSTNKQQLSNLQKDDSQFPPLTGVNSFYPSTLQPTPPPTHTHKRTHAHARTHATKRHLL